MEASGSSKNQYVKRLIDNCGTEMTLFPLDFRIEQNGKTAPDYKARRLIVKLMKDSHANLRLISTLLQARY